MTPPAVPDLDEASAMAGGRSTGTVADERSSAAQRHAALADLTVSLLDDGADEVRIGTTLGAFADDQLGCAASFWLAGDDAEHLVCLATTWQGRAGPHPTDVATMAAAGLGAEVSRAELDAITGGRSADGLVLPLESRGRLVGAWAIQHRRHAALCEDDRTFAAAAARIAAAAHQHGTILADAIHLAAELRSSTELLDNISDAIITLDADRRIMSWNAGAETLYGYSASEVVGADLFALLDTTPHPADSSGGSLEQTLAELTTTRRWTGEVRERHAAGQTVIAQSSLSLYPRPPGPPGLIVVNRDITQQRLEQHAASHDPLTGLPNRRMLLERLHETFARTCRGEDRMAVLFLDLNGFKPVNDQYGHAAGDAVLRETAARLRKAIRTEDTAARLGGDEFVVLLERAGDPDAAVNVAKRIAGALAAPIQYDELTITVTTSIGVAHLDAGDTAGPPSDAAALLDAADAAMYHAKQTGIGIALHSADGPAAAP